jgi:UDPglucose 6-dehydrogenase
VAAACIADLGHRVRCLDVNVDRIAALRAGRVPLTEPRLDDMVADGIKGGRLSFTTSPADLHGMALVMVAVGTLDANGEWTAEVVREVVLGLARDEHGPRSIVIRSTLLPGTAAHLAAEVTRIDPTIGLALNPEFTREGSAVSDFLRPDRVVIGTEDPTSAVVADLRRLYEALEAQIVVTDLTSAEMIKVGSNVFLAAKIAYANELARLCRSTGANVADVVDGIGLDRRIGRAFLSPGPGFGGSCLPAQARALPAFARQLGVSAPVLEAIDDSNEMQVSWLLDVATTTLGRDLRHARAAVLGLTFKAETDDLRESPALALVRALVRQGASVSVHDPTGASRAVAELRRTDVEVAPADAVLDACRDADVTFVATEWREYLELDWERVREVMAGDVIVDCRSIVSVERASLSGLRVVGLTRRESVDPTPATVAAGAASGGH